MQKFKTPYEESQWESNSKVLPDGNPLSFAPKKNSSFNKGRFIE
jgi:hypothetical protein